MDASPSLLRAQASQQFLLGNHSWSHPDMTTLSRAGQTAQMADATNEQRSIVGFAPCLFRPPYGAYDSTTLDVASERNLEVWNWSVDTQDWMAGGSGSQFWVDRIVQRATAGGSQQHPVVLMHNQPGGNPATIEALPRIIAFYRDRGYTFVDLAGRIADRHVTGDWDGDGRATPGVVRGRTWYLRNSNSSGPADVVLDFGFARDRVVVGDWDGDGVDTPGVVRGGTWYLRDTNDPGNGGKASVRFGNSNYLPVPGDWDGDGTSAPGVYRNGVWHLRGGNGPGEGKLVLRFGAFGYRPVSGDWDGDGDTEPGVVRDNLWYQRDGIDPSDGSRNILRFGAATDRLITGDWDGDGTTTPGVVRGGDDWYLRSTNTSGGANWSYTFGPDGGLATAGE
jgi:Polysaccharide deacetylase